MNWKATARTAHLLVTVEFGGGARAPWLWSVSYAHREPMLEPITFNGALSADLVCGAEATEELARTVAFNRAMEIENTPDELARLLETYLALAEVA